MLIAKVQDNQVLEVIDSRSILGNTSLTDEQLSDLGYMQVNLFRQHDALTEKLIQATPVIEGNWVFTVAVAKLTDEEIQSAKDSAMANIRARRNQLLKDTDGTQAVDNPSSKKTDWATYRQQLRDIPATIENADPRTWNDWPHDPDYKPLTSIV